MDFQCPLYLLRAGGCVLVAFSVHELGEVLACARDAGDHVDLVHLYYGQRAATSARELERVASVLLQC
ncbi:MAG: hypothetical protein IRZ32_17145 [Solirubrobacteraceae bacterium]|nr:hypothetical protein [Solirubrobacteraceae bacterium]